MAPSSRLAVRLATLPHDALVQLFTHDALAEFAAQACADSPAVAARAEAVLAAHQPVPQWAVEGVLLSSDLVPHVLAPLEQEDGAAAAACSAWAAGWRATAEERRRLYVIGGDNALGNECLASVEIFDPQTNSWTAGVALPAGRSYAAAAALEGKIYLVGDFGSSSKVEAFDP